MHKLHPLPPKLRSIIDYNWEFPVDFPVVNNATTPDAVRTLKAVISFSLQNYFYDHRIYTHNVADFTRHFQNHLYNKMVQHQYWIDQYLNLIDDNQFFYNDETQNLSRNVNGTANGLAKTMDTPQNITADIETHLTEATKTTDSNSGTETNLNTIHKSTLGDITVQFKNFANFSNFIEQLIAAVKPCFILTYSKYYDIDEGYVGFTEVRLTNPNRTAVYDVIGQLVAVFTDDAKTVALRGADRTFTETSQGVYDTFGRVIADSFGRAETGGRYFITESSDTDFEVVDGVGKMLCDTVNTSRRATLTQTNIHKSFEGQVKITTDKAAAGAGQDGGITFGYVDLLNHYEAVLRFSSSGNVQVGIIKKIDGDTNNIGSFVVVAESRTPGDFFRLKVSWNGSTGVIKTKAWLVGEPEPSSWHVEVTDTTYTQGRLGLRSILNPSTSNAPVLFTYDDFIGTGDWPVNPTVTHNTWVRFLDTPFNGQFLTNKVLVDWLIETLKDTSNDLLAEAMRYISTGDLNNHYGLLEADGTRQDGGDWNDYLSQTGYYPDTAEADDPPEENQLGCLDCSGYVRLLFKTFGIPLSLYVFDGVHVPRESKDIMDDGPGVNINPRNGTVQLTDFSKLQIGDLVGFDADETDPEEGQIDHLGIYIGVDSITGKRRFISSRATPDGATFADLGGQSVIDGTTNLYTKTLRCVRRV